LIVSAPESAPALIRSAVSEPVLNLNVDLKPASHVRLKVQGSGGQPVRGAYLVLVDWRDLRWLESMHRSDDDGVITFPDAPAEDAKYLVSAAGMSSEILTLRPGSEHVAILRPLTRR